MVESVRCGAQPHRRSATTWFVTPCGIALALRSTHQVCAHMLCALPGRSPRTHIITCLPTGKVSAHTHHYLPSYREGLRAHTSLLAFLPGRSPRTHMRARTLFSRPRPRFPTLESAIAHPGLPLNEREETRRSRVDNVGCALARGVAGRVEFEAVADERDEQVFIPWMGVAQSCEHC